MVASFKELFSNISFILKFVVWILLIIGSVILGLGDVGYYDRFTMETVIVAVAGFCLIITAFLIIYIFDEPHRLYELLYLITGGILNLVAGILNLVEYIRASHTHTANSLIILIVCIAAGILMILDFAWKLAK